MSQRREHKKRYNRKLEFIANFEHWLYNEPPMWQFIARRRWKNKRPKWED